LEVGRNIETHNNSLLGECKVESFYLDVGRIIGNFHFPLLPWELSGLMSPAVREGANFLWGRGIGQHSVTYRTHVALPCGCSILMTE